MWQVYVVRDGICKEPARTWSIICNYVNIMHILMKSTKVQTLGGIWRKYWNIWIENNFSCICIG